MDQITLYEYITKSDNTM